MTRTSCLNRVERETLEKRGCAYFDDAAEAYELRKDWTHRQANTFFENLFPLPFAYLASLNNSKGKSAELKCQWMLINKEKHHYHLVTTENPGGKQLHFFRGSSKPSVATTNVIIGAYSPLMWYYLPLLIAFFCSPSNPHSRRSICVLGPKLQASGG